MKITSFLFALSFCLCLSAQDSMNMISLYHWEGGGEVGSSYFDNVYNEVWGYTQSGREYAIIGTTQGTHFLDITTTEEASEVDFIPGSLASPLVIHRDYHNYNNYLYMVCQEGSSLQIADLSYLPDSVHLVYDSNELLAGTHNIFVDTTQAILYTVYSFVPGVNQGPWMQRIDISNPESPVLIENYTNNGLLHDLYVDDGIAILNGGTSGMSIFDYNTTPASFLGSIDNYPGVGYNHSGYPTPDGSIYVMADETHGSPIKILDISDPSDIQVLSTVTSGVHELSIAHNQIVHENKMYSAYYYDGVYVWSIENPENPVLLGYFDTSTLPHQDSYEGAWGVYPFLPSGKILVSDMQTGLWVLELDVTLSATSVNEIQRLKLWPNPASTFIEIDVTSFQSEVIYSILDITGKIIISGESSFDVSLRIETSHLEDGIYTIIIEDQFFKQSGKFMVAND